jgi:hypothetical protein
MCMYIYVYVYVLTHTGTYMYMYMYEHTLYMYIHEHTQGFADTMGLSSVKYMIADRVVAPPENEGLFQEHLVLMPSCYHFDMYPPPHMTCILLLIPGTPCLDALVLPLLLCPPQSLSQ